MVIPGALTIHTIITEVIIAAYTTEGVIIVIGIGINGAGLGVYPV